MQHIQSLTKLSRRSQMSSKYDNMGKDALRAACRTAGISYGKLNNQGMRDALVVYDNHTAEIAAFDNITKEDIKNAHALHTTGASQVLADELDEKDPTDAEIAESNQIHIGSNLSAESATIPNAATHGEKGQTVTRGAPNALKALKASTSGFKIEKEREEKNGVKRPSIGGMCRAVWDALDSVVTAGGSPTAKDVKAMSEKNSWNVNNASIEFYNWRRFNGISGRKTKKA